MHRDTRKRISFFAFMFSFSLLARLKFLGKDDRRVLYVIFIKIFKAKHINIFTVYIKIKNKKECN